MIDRIGIRLVSIFCTIGSYYITPGVSVIHMRMCMIKIWNICLY